MQSEFNGIERRLDELEERLAKLKPLTERPRTDFDQDALLRDLVERNLEVVALCCIDICHRIISITGAQKPRDDHEAILRMSELDILPGDFARGLAPIAGFHNVLEFEYLEIDWDEVYRNLQHLDGLKQFAIYIRRWMQSQESQG